MTMLWYKAWLDTRWRFLVGFALLACAASLTVLGYPRVSRLLTTAPAVDTTTEVGRRLKEMLDLSRGFRGYVWTQWFRQTAIQLVTLFAILLGSGGVLSHGGGGELYTLSLPASRSRLLFVRAALGLGELWLIAFVPAIVIAVMAPAVGERYSVVGAAVHGLCLFVGCAAFFSLALLLSTSYSDVWRPMLIAGAAAFVIRVVEEASRSVAPYGIFTLTAGETFFRTGGVPWLGLAAAAALSAALIYTAATNIERRDY